MTQEFDAKAAREAVHKALIRIAEEEDKAPIDWVLAAIDDEANNGGTVTYTGELNSSQIRRLIQLGFSVERNIFSISPERLYKISW